MLDFLKKIFGTSIKVDYKELMMKGAQIIDVRTPEEFVSGHIKGSVNIPLQVLEKKISTIKKDKPIITCCASGMRSGSAKRILLANGYTDVYNGGGWFVLQNNIH